MLSNMKKVLIGLAMMSIAPLANAQMAASSDLLGYVGFAAGYADPTSINGRFGLGGDAGMMFSNGMIANVFYRSSSDKESKRNVQVDHYGLGADWSLAKYLPGPFGGFRGGLRAGVSTIEADSKPGVPRVSDTEFAFGPTLGYDFIHLPYNFSLGGEANLLFTMGPAQFATLYVTANLKYWF